MSDRTEYMSQAVGSQPTGRRRSRPDPAAVAAVLLSAACFVVLFLGWNDLCLRLGGHDVCREEFGVLSGWAGFGVAAGMAAVCLVLWEVLSAAGALVLRGAADERRVGAAFGAALGLFALLRVLTHLSGLTASGWLGLALALAACAVALARLPGARPLAGRAGFRTRAQPPPETG